MAAATSWRVERVVRFPEGEHYGGGLSHLGFHAPDGTQFVVDHERHWAGAYDGDELAWTAGSAQAPASRVHVDLELEYPMYVACASDGGFLVSNFGNGRVYRVLPEERRAEVLVDGRMEHAGNCPVDADGCFWVNDVTGYRVWRFAPDGEPLLTVGSGERGFERGTVPLAEARFAWIYDLRLGPDGLVYVLDSGNFALRRIDPARGTVETLAGTGEPGYDGDGGDAREATFGSKPDERYDGPYSLALDEDGNVFVGDTWNHALREIDVRTGVIETIANSPAICSLDYFGGRIFLPDLSGELAILTRR